MTDRLAAEMVCVTAHLRAALREGNMDLAQTLASVKVGLRVCAGDILVTLPPVRL